MKAWFGPLLSHALVLCVVACQLSAACFPRLPQSEEPRVNDPSRQGSRPAAEMVVRRTMVLTRRISTITEWRVLNETLGKTKRMRLYSNWEIDTRATRSRFARLLKYVDDEPRGLG